MTAVNVWVSQVLKRVRARLRVRLRVRVRLRPRLRLRPGRVMEELVIYS